ncbi:MAG: cystathionine beta-lyase [Candidatus Marinimicrobia bacterium]|nr:cystathionine beta-lyase [Candidatus Neomarinimicrobiota bacterium]|tara:strand:- start:6388 stop:7581 length:1194 start_codon:yes stop_codon:yes gene_type:complete
MKYDPASEIQDHQVFGEFGGVNPSITDSSTFTFMKPDTMKELFENEIEGCFLYSRHWNPSNKYLSEALAKLEDTESAQVTSSGISAIACTILQICKSGDEIISSRTIYGGTWALFKNILPKFGINVKFVDINNLSRVKSLINKNTKLIFCETISNPLLDVSDLPKLSMIAKSDNLKLVVDNTFSPMVISPYKLGADVVIHSLTKYINGASDCVAGCICASNEFINELTDINHGMTMLLGPVLDSFRSSSILKNLNTLHIRMKQHSMNAKYLAEKIDKMGYNVFYPGLKKHPQYNLITSFKNDGFGYSGMLGIDVGTLDQGEKILESMQKEKIGYLAVSLGYYKTLFSLPGSSTSSEIPEDEQNKMGLSKGIIRFSVGLDNDIGRTFNRIKKCLKNLK